MPINSGDIDRLEMMLIFSQIRSTKKKVDRMDDYVIIDTLIAKGWRIYQEPEIITKPKSKIRKKVGYTWRKLQKLIVPHFL